MGKVSGIPAEKLALYEKLVATRLEMERKGAAMPYSSRNGHMFSFLDEDGKLSLRLGEEDLEAFLKKCRTKRSVQYGREMKEYAAVPVGVLMKTAELKKWFGKNVDYVGGVKAEGDEEEVMIWSGGSG